MPILYQNNAEMGSNGTDATTSNTGDANNRAWDTVENTFPGATTFSSTRKFTGSLSYKLDTLDSSFNSLRWSFPSALPTVYTSILMYVQSGTSIVTTPIAGYTAGGGALCGGFNVNLTGNVELIDKTGSPMATSFRQVPKNQWVRLDCKIVGSASGSVEVMIYGSPYDSTPLETVQASGDTGAAVKEIFFGQSTATVIYLDDIIARDDAYPQRINGMSTAWMQF